MNYYSLKTKKEEHCLEARIGGDFDYAIYDLKQNLTKPKEVIKKEDIVKFIYDTQKKLGGAFVKVDTTTDTPKEVAKILPENKSEDKQEDVLQRLLKKGFNIDILKSALSSKKHIDEVITTDRARVSIQGYNSDVSSSYPKLNKEDEYVLVSRLNLKTNEVTIEVHSSLTKDIDEVAKQQTIIVNHLFLGLFSVMPSILEGHVCSNASFKLGTSYETAVTQYKQQKSLRYKLYSSILDTLSKVADIYKEQIVKF